MIYVCYRLYSARCIFTNYYSTGILHNDNDYHIIGIYYSARKRYCLSFYQTKHSIGCHVKRSPILNAAYLIV